LDFFFWAKVSEAEPRRIRRRNLFIACEKPLNLRKEGGGTNTLGMSGKRKVAAQNPPMT
jgi:hypothetical protein